MITLFYAYARSGGTLLNRILAAMGDNVVLSEVLPANQGGSAAQGVESGGVWHQALYWYDIRLKNKEYIPALLELDDLCQRSGRHLIVREWCTRFYYNIPSSGDKTQRPHRLFALNHLKEQARPFALVRHGSDTFKSEHPDSDVWLNEAIEYAKAYLVYAQDIHTSRMPIYDYAELCAHPYEFVKKLCSYLDIPFDKTGIARFAHIITACGDTFMRGRYVDSTTIRPLKRRVLPDIAQENRYRTNADFRRADSLLGLKPDSPLEPEAHAIMEKHVKFPSERPLPALLPFEEITDTPLWRYDDIMHLSTSKSRPYLLL